MPTLGERLATAIDVSAAFDNCFFNSYAAFLLASNLPLPDTLFTFTSLLGNNSRATRLRRILPSKDALDIFQKYRDLIPIIGPEYPNFMVEKTLVLGILLREWFATQLNDNSTHRDAMLIRREGDAVNGDVVSMFTTYKMFRQNGLEKEDLIHQSIINEANEAFLEYLVARPVTTRPLSAKETDFESFFSSARLSPDYTAAVALDVTEEDLGVLETDAAIKAYWIDQGYSAYCQHMAKPNVKLGVSDFSPVLQSMGQPLTIHNSDGSQALFEGSPSNPKMELKLHPTSGHFLLLKPEDATPVTDALLEEYRVSYAQYQRDRETIGEATNATKQAVAANAPSLLVKAICIKHTHASWEPFDALLQQLNRMEMLDKHAKFMNSLQILISKRDEFTQIMGTLSLDSSQYESYESARNVTDVLYENLKLAAKRYFLDQSLTANAFQQACTQHINNTRPVLEVHRGFKAVLESILYMALGLFTGWDGDIYKEKSRRARTQQYMFFSTESAQRLDTLQDAVYNINTVNLEAEAPAVSRPGGRSGGS
jgi:hypothetical protein